MKSSNEWIRNYEKDRIHESLHYNSRDTNMHKVSEYYNDVIMGAIASQITSLTIVYSIVYSDRSKETSELRVTGLCVRNSPGNAKNVSIWWRHHGKFSYVCAAFEWQQSRDVARKIMSLVWHGCITVNEQFWHVIRVTNSWDINH